MKSFKGGIVYLLNGLLLVGVDDSGASILGYDHCCHLGDPLLVLLQHTVTMTTIDTPL